MRSVHLYMYVFVSVQVHYCKSGLSHHVTEMLSPYWLIEYPTETKEYLVSQSEQSISPFQFWAGCSSQSISNYHNIKYNIDVIRSIVLCERRYMINTLKLSNSCVIYYSSIAPAHSI